MVHLIVTYDVLKVSTVTGQDQIDTATGGRQTALLNQVIEEVLQVVGTQRVWRTVEITCQISDHHQVGIVGTLRKATLTHGRDHLLSQGSHRRHSC